MTGVQTCALPIYRTAKAWALAIAGAEYLLGWLPRGTHDWKKFVRPSEVVNGLRSAGIDAQEIVGVVYRPPSRSWSLHQSPPHLNSIPHRPNIGGP